MYDHAHGERPCGSTPGRVELGGSSRRERRCERTSLHAGRSSGQYTCRAARLCTDTLRGSHGCETPQGASAGRAPVLTAIPQRITLAMNHHVHVRRREPLLTPHTAGARSPETLLLPVEGLVGCRSGAPAHTLTLPASRQLPELSTSLTAAKQERSEAHTLTLPAHLHTTDAVVEE